MFKANSKTQQRQVECDILCSIHSVTDATMLLCHILNKANVKVVYLLMCVLCLCVCVRACVGDRVGPVCVCGGDGGCRGQGLLCRGGHQR